MTHYLPGSSPSRHFERREDPGVEVDKATEAFDMRNSGLERHEQRRRQCQRKTASKLPWGDQGTFYTDVARTLIHFCTVFQNRNEIAMPSLAI